MKKLLSLFLVSSLVFGAAAIGAAELVIKAGHPTPETASLHKGFLKFKELIEAKSGGKIAVEIYPNQQVGGDREMIESLQMNNLSITSVSGTNVTSFAKQFSITDLFFVFDTHAKARAVYDSAAGKLLFSYLEPIGIKGVGVMENGFRNFTNSKRPVAKVEDLKGIKMRVAENPVQIAAWKALGASPTPMAWGELFTALQQGTLDGQEATIENIGVMHFDEVQKYLSITRHNYTPFVVLASKDFYDRLSAQQRAWFDESMAEAVLYQRDQAKANEDRQLATLKANGKIAITEFGAAELSEFRARCAEINEKMVKERCGPEIYNAFMAEIEKANQKK